MSGISTRHERAERAEPGHRVLGLPWVKRQVVPAAPIELWGYSGGGLASAWAAEMQKYAPDLGIVGAVLGTPVDLGHTFRQLNGTLLAGLPALVVVALQHSYPGLAG